MKTNIKLGVALLAMLSATTPACRATVAPPPPPTADRQANGVTPPSNAVGAPTATATLTAPDPARLRGAFSPGFQLNYVSTGQNFAGMNWPRLGTVKKERVFQNVAGNFQSMSFNFECVSGQLPLTSTPNPHLFMVIQDSGGDYFQTTTAVAPQYTGMTKTGYDLFFITGTSSDFGGLTGTPIQSAVVFSGDARFWNGDNSFLPAIPSSVYVTAPTITTDQGTYVPVAYHTQGADLLFNFQQPSPAQ